MVLPNANSSTHVSDPRDSVYRAAITRALHGSRAEPGDLEACLHRWFGAEAPNPFGFGRRLTCLLNEIKEGTHGEFRRILNLLLPLVDNAINMEPVSLSLDWALGINRLE